MTKDKFTKLGIDLKGVNGPVPLSQLFSDRYVGQWDNISTESLERIGIIREIIREYNRSEEHIGETVLTCYQAANVLRDYFRGLCREESVALYLDSCSHILRRMPITSGLTDATLMDVQGIIRNALLLSASMVIIAHNHPSNDPQPSSADIRETARMREACNSMGIKLCDHLIITTSEFFSFDEGRTHRYIKTTASNK